MTENTLDKSSILAKLPKSIHDKIESFEIFEQLASTNSYLTQQPAKTADQYLIAMANHQTAGRGRGQSTWLSSPHSGINLSLAFTLRRPARDAAALTLALGVATVQALRARDIAGIQLKWPNDLVLGDNKLGGILCELHSTAEGAAAVVAGVGLNVNSRPEPKMLIVSDWARRAADLSAFNVAQRDRNMLAAAIIDNWISAIELFVEQGLQPFVKTWRELDWLNSKAVEVDTASGKLSGLAAGITDAGALLVADGDCLHQVISGSVRLCAR